MSSHSVQRPRKTLADIAHNEVTAWIVLALSLVLTASAWQVSSVYVERRAQERFQYAVEDAKFAIVKRMQEYEQTLRGGVALFNATGRVVNREQWHTFVTTLNIEKYFPGLQGIGFALWVPPAEKAAVIAGIRAEGYPEFSIKPEGEREVYTAIIYLEPLDGRNLRAFGYDMFSEPTRRAAMEFSRDAESAAVSGRVVLVQETKEDIQAGFLMYLPVYKSGAELATLEQRREAILGFVYSPFRIKDLMRGILGQGAPGLDFQIYDGEQVNTEELLFDTGNAWHEDAKGRTQESAYTARNSINLPGRTWTVEYSSRENFEAEMSSNQPILVAIGGLFVDLLLFSIIWSLSQQRKRVLEKATEMTAKLRSSRGQFRAITETAYDAIVSTDSSGKIIYCNPAACNTFDIIAENMLGMSIATLLPERLRNAHQSGLIKTFAQGRSSQISETFETIGTRADNTEFPLEVSISNWNTDEGTFFTLLMRDISERRKIDRLKSEFVSTVSHELRTPLTAIRGALGLVCSAGDKIPAAKISELVDIAYQNTERLARLVNDILDLEKLESGKLALDVQAVKVADLLAEAIKENLYYALPHEVTIELAQPIAAVTITADPNRLMQVLSNLISNAIKFSEPNSTVSLSAVVNDEVVRVSVTDAGSGIPDDFKDRLFHRFSQADASDTRQKGGSGLGLSICKSIIDLHGGTIGYESLPEKGTCFYFEVPGPANGLQPN